MDSDTELKAVHRAPSSASAAYLVGSLKTKSVSHIYYRKIQHEKKKSSQDLTHNHV